MRKITYREDKGITHLEYESNSGVAVSRGTDKKDALQKLQDFVRQVLNANMKYASQEWIDDMNWLLRQKP